MNKMLKTLITYSISIITLIFSFNAQAQYCLSIKDKIGTPLSSAGSAQIDNNHLVYLGGKGAGSSTGGVKTCGDSWSANPTCKRGYGPSSKPTDSCAQIESNQECQDYYKTGTGSSSVKESCDKLKEQCQETQECINPAPIEGNPVIISQFYRSNGDLHGGIDYAAPYGTPALAPMDGIYKPNGTGSVRIFSQAQGITAEFHHLFCTPTELSSGDWVKKGEIIGWVGNTGQSAGPHMHIGFFDGETKPSSRSGFINSMANETNEQFCDVPSNACMDLNNTNPNASGTTEQSFTDCSGNTVQGTINSAGGYGLTVNPGATAAALGEENEGCHPARFMSWFDNCLFCHLFKTVYNAASAIAKVAYGKFAEPVANVLVVAAALWIALKTMPLVSSLKNGDGAEFIMDLLKQMLVIFIIIIFLKTGGLGFFTYIMEPIFNTGFALAKTLLDTGAPCKDDYGILTQAQGGGLPASMGNSAVCVIEQIQYSVSHVLAIGMTSLCVGLFVDATIPVILPDFSYLLTGLLLLLGGTFLLVIFPFIVLDTILQLAVAAALLPMAMACFAFEATKKYTKIVWDTFMAAVFNFVFLCLIMVICVKTIDIIIGDTLLVSLASKELSKSENITILQEIGWESVLFLKVLFMFVLAKVMLEEVNEFASDFSGGDNFKLDMSSEAGGVLASGMLNTGKRTLLAGTKAGVKKAGKAISRGWGSMRRQQRANYQRNMFNKHAVAKQSAAPITSPALESAISKQTLAQNKFDSLVNSNAGAKAIAKARTNLITANQNVNKERNKLKNQAPTQGPRELEFNKKLFGFIGVGGALGSVKMTEAQDGSIIRTEKRQNKTITKTYGSDAQGRSTVSVLKEDLTKRNAAAKLVKKYRQAHQDGKVTEIRNDDGSITYLKNSNNKKGITVNADGSIIKHKDGFILGSRSKEVNIGVATTTKTQSHDQNTFQRTNSKGEVIYEDSTNRGKSISKPDGSINEKAIDELKQGQKKLEAQLLEEKDPAIIANLKKEIEKEKIRTDKIIAKSVIANTISKDYNNLDSNGYVSQQIIPADESNNNTITIIQTDVNGRDTTYKVKIDGDKHPKVSFEKQNADGSKTSVKTDGILQKKTTTTADGKIFSKYALADYSKIRSITDPDKAEAKLNEILKDSDMFSSQEKQNAIKYLKKIIEDQKRFSRIDALR